MNEKIGRKITKEENLKYDVLIISLEKLKGQEIRVNWKQDVRSWAEVIEEILNKRSRN